MSLVLDLDNVAEITPRNPKTRDSLENRFYSEDAKKWDWKARTTTLTEDIYTNTIPEKADLYHYNYLSYLQECYGTHRKIVLAPHTMWHTIMCEIANFVTANPKQHQSIFTRAIGDEKINIIVECASEYEPLRMDEIYVKMLELVPVNTELFLPNFSTLTERSRLAILGAFLETCSPYYNYMMLACGFPQIRIDGTKEDWVLISYNLMELIKEFKKVDSKIADYLTKNVSPIIAKIIEAMTTPDKDWFKQIFTQKRCGSGSQYFVNGWYTDLFMDGRPGQPKVSNFPVHITKVPYITLPSSTKWNLFFSLSHSFRDDDGFMVPDFGQVQVQKLAEPKVIYEDEKNLQIVKEIIARPAVKTPVIEEVEERRKFFVKHD